MSLVSIQDLEEYLQITIDGTSNQTKYEFLIVAVQALADKLTFRTLEEDTFVSELHDGNTTNLVFLNNSPITNVESVEYGHVLNGCSRSEIASTDYLVYNDEGYLAFAFESPEGNQLFEITYTGGFSADPSNYTLPEDLRQHLLDQVQISYNTKWADPALKSDKQGDAKEEYKSSSELGDISMFEMKLGKYIKSI